MSTIKATLVRKLEGFSGDARLYKLSEPVPCWDDKQTEYVIISAATVPFSGPETYVFSASADGKVTKWSEMSGSFRGGLNHGEAIRNSGWVEEDVPTPPVDKGPIFGRKLAIEDDKEPRR